MVAASDLISVAAAGIALGSLGVAISSNSKAGPKLGSQARLQKMGSTPHDLKLEYQLFNTGLASTRIDAIFLFNDSLFGPIKVSAYAVDDGPKDADGYVIGPNDGARWTIDVDRVIRGARDDELTEQFFRAWHRDLPRIVLRTMMYFGMAMTIFLLPRALKRDYLEVIVVFKNGVEFRTPVLTGWILQGRWMSNLAVEELKRRQLYRKRWLRS